MSERHSRQVRLIEVGLEGQRRVASSTHVICGHGLAAKVEARYLAGAGVKALEVEDEGVAAGAREVDGTVNVRVTEHDCDHEHRDPSWARDLSVPARDVALGAYRALCALRHVVRSVTEPAP
jgi:hypothetical protein